MTAPGGEPGGTKRHVVAGRCRREGLRTPSASSRASATSPARVNHGAVAPPASAPTVVMTVKVAEDSTAERPTTHEATAGVAPKPRSWPYLKCIAKAWPPGRVMLSDRAA